MLITSKEANKLLKKCYDELEITRIKENQSLYFIAAAGEVIESVRPEYDFESTQRKIEAINSNVLHIKHRLNKFNTSTTLENSNLTIDEVLVLLPQLNELKNKYERMLKHLPKNRRVSSGTFIEYEYANYDLKAVETSYNNITRDINGLQLELDKVNSTARFEIDLPFPLEELK
jgi:DNA repair ATPase RecN